MHPLRTEMARLAATGLPWPEAAGFLKGAEYAYNICDYKVAELEEKNGKLHAALTEAARLRGSLEERLAGLADANFMLREQIEIVKQQLAVYKSEVVEWEEKQPTTFYLWLRSCLSRTPSPRK